MSDDIETLRHLAYGLGTEERKEAVAALERLSARDEIYKERKTLLDEASALMNAAFAEFDALRAERERAKEALKEAREALIETGCCDDDDPPIKMIDAELSADAPAPPPQISDEMVEAAIKASEGEDDFISAVRKIIAAALKVTERTQ